MNESVSANKMSFLFICNGVFDEIRVRSFCMTYPGGCKLHTSYTNNKTITKI